MIPILPLNQKVCRLMLMAVGTILYDSQTILMEMLWGQQLTTICPWMVTLLRFPMPIRFSPCLLLVLCLLCLSGPCTLGLQKVVYHIQWLILCTNILCSNLYQWGRRIHSFHYSSHPTTPRSFGHFRFWPPCRPHHACGLSTIGHGCLCHRWPTAYCCWTWLWWGAFGRSICDSFCDWR